MKEIYRNIASEVGISVEYLTNTKQLELLEKFAELVRADEREACAVVCLEGTDMPVQVDALKIIRAERERISNTIRARGER